MTKPLVTKLSSPPPSETDQISHFFPPPWCQVTQLNSHRCEWGEGVLNVMCKLSHWSPEIQYGTSRRITLAGGEKNLSDRKRDDTECYLPYLYNFFFYIAIGHWKKLFSLTPVEESSNESGFSLNFTIIS